MREILLNTLTLFSLVYLTYNKSCKTSDIKQFFTDCKENKREIIFYMSRDCNNTNHIQLPQMISDIPCNIRCEKGKYLNYNLMTNKPECKLCEANTYSTGGAFLINGALKEWNDKHLSLFENHCFIYYGNTEITKNKNCSNWSINSESSNIHTGTSDISYGNYYSHLSIGMVLKRNGFIEFKYKKDSISDGYYSNGIIEFFIDFNLSLFDSYKNDVWQTVKYNLTSGYHNFLWRYVFYFDNNVPASKNLRAYIDYIKIDGVDFADTICKKCGNKFSEEGSDSCIFCGYNYFFNEETQLCEKCINNTYSFPNSIGAKSCLAKHKCTESDYTAIASSCENGQKKISYQWDEPLICDNSSRTLPLPYTENCTICYEGGYLKLPENKCKDCDEGYYSNTETFKNSVERCDKCQHGYSAIKILNITTFSQVATYFDNYCSSILSENCININGFKVKLNKLVAGNYLPGTLDLNLVLKFEVANKGEISYDFKLINFMSNDTFHVKINGLIQGKFFFNLEKYTSNGNYSRTYSMQKGSYEFVWSYSRLNSSNNNNAVEINHILVKGSNIGGGVKCSLCPEVRSYLKKENISNEQTENKCDLCPNGFTSNSERSTCISCPDGTYNDGFTNGICETCPAYTFSNQNRTGCIVLDILHNKRYLLRIYSGSVKDQFNNLCNNNLEICYKSFLGPIKKGVDSSLFFMSPFISEIINITDFSYISDNNSPNGYIFALFSKDVINKNSQIFKVENTKVIKNLGKKIAYIKMFPYTNDSIISRDGFVIKYNDGDICLKNPSKFYQTFIFFICDKSKDARAPRLVSAQDECTYIFEWRGKGACPQCTKNGEINTKSLCSDYKRSIFYKEESNCNIFTTNNNSYGQNITFDDDLNIIKESSNEETAIINYFKENSEKELKLNKSYVNPKVKNMSFQGNLSVNESFYYIYDWREEENCSILDNFDKNIILLGVVVPVLYFFFLILLIFFCCKYKKAKHNYQKLREEGETETQSNQQEKDNKIEQGL